MRYYSAALPNSSSPFRNMYSAGILYARTAAPWPVPWQVLARPHDPRNASTADLDALNLLALNTGTTNRNTHCRTTGSVHLFGALEGLRVTGSLEHKTVGQDHIVPCLIPTGFEGIQRCPPSGKQLTTCSSRVKYNSARIFVDKPSWQGISRQGVTCHVLAAEMYRSSPGMSARPIDELLPYAAKANGRPG